MIMVIWIATMMRDGDRGIDINIDGADGGNDDVVTMLIMVMACTLVMILAMLMAMLKACMITGSLWRW